MCREYRCDTCCKKGEVGKELINIDPGLLGIVGDLKRDFINYDGIVCQECYEKMCRPEYTIIASMLRDIDSLSRKLSDSKAKADLEKLYTKYDDKFINEIVSPYIDKLEEGGGLL